MDTAHPENVAEDLISHKLQKAGLLVAKPKFDRVGTDLLVFAQMADGVRFCRIQCKYRSFQSGNTTNITIPASYVTNGFVLIVYISSNKDEEGLFIFFATDIKQWKCTKDNKFRLTLNRSKYEAALKSYLFDDSKLGLINSVIELAEMSGEFRDLVYGSANLSVPAPTLRATLESKI